jgi:hypothetical protein
MASLDARQSLMQATSIPWDVRLTMEELKTALAPFFPFSKQTDERLAEYSVFQPIEECLDNVRECGGGDQPPELVYLAGGSADLPIINAALRWRFPSSGRTTVEPTMEAIALGAAWYAGMLAEYPGSEMKLTQRMYEGIYMRTRARTLEEIVSPQAVLPLKEYVIPHTFRMPDYSDRIELDLFSGTRPDDPKMQPLARRFLSFAKVVPSEREVKVIISVSRDRKINLRCTAEGNGEEINGHVEVETGEGRRKENEEGVTLPRVNPMPSRKP